MDGFTSAFPALSLQSSADIAKTASLMKTALLIILLIFAVLLFSSILYTVFSVRNGNIRKGSAKALMIILYIVTAIVLVCFLFCLTAYQRVEDSLAQPTTVPTEQTEPTTEPTEPPTEPTEPPTEPEPTLSPMQTEQSNPANWNIKWDVIAGDAITDSFQRADPITFGKGSEYTKMEGIITFRGDNYRSGATYGTAKVTEKKLNQSWSRNIGTLNGWPGSGWTGQSLIVRWDQETKNEMNLYPEKKEKDGLVEVIYATLDGYVYFYDLDDGSYTRDPIYLGMNFKGAGALDPRGYPLFYVGSGDVYNKVPRMYIVSLIDGSILEEISGFDSFANRGWYAFDSSPLVDAETDTLIWPGENGILYTIKLNTDYNKSAGTISVHPEQVAKTRYSTQTNRSLGYECSCIIVENYLYIGDNGGYFYCVDLNTMKLVWALDTKDDTNATPVFEWGDDGVGYIYTATSMEYNNGTSYIYKLNANTGEIVWQKAYDGIIYDKGVSGGVLGSPVLGKPGTDLEGLIVYTIAKAPSAWTGTVVALNTQTGEVVWEEKIQNYAWSSPVAVYTDSGDGYIVLFDSAGTGRFFEGKTGKVLSTVSVGSNVEASPTVFENKLVIGTRGQKVFGFTIS